MEHHGAASCRYALAAGSIHVKEPQTHVADDLPRLVDDGNCLSELHLVSPISAGLL